MYYCDKCGGESTLREEIINGIRLGAVVCKKCGAVYPSYFINEEISSKMASVRGDADALECLAKRNRKLIKKNRRLFKEVFGR